MTHRVLSLLFGLVLSALCLSTVYAQDENQETPSSQRIFLPYVQNPSSPSEQTGEWKHYRINAETPEIEPDYTVIEPAGVCMPPALWERGEVKWIMFGATKTYGFSVKPETSNALI
ncbi:MAG: hypothetical protein BroJett021_38930 [Chloroflexota bacterium]|nr:MAG: hypothetical protein BroJett021_38930 [Chloroflexota bacterium]